MKSKAILIIMALAMTVAHTNVMAQDSISGGKTTRPETVSRKADAKKSQASKSVSGSFTVNGKPATPQQKQAAKQMVKQAAKMAGKAAQVAATAVTNPAKAERLGEELEHMGDQLEAMGDDLERMDSSLSELAEDTTFLYDGDDDTEFDLDVDLDDEDVDEILSEWESDGWGPWRWVQRIFSSGTGLFGSALAGIGVAFVMLFLFALFTSPIWVVFLILYLIIRSGRKREAERMAQAYGMHAQAQPAAAAAAAQGASAQPSQPGAEKTQAARTAAATPRQAVPNAWDENQETWKNGIRQSCLGVGFVICFFIVGWKIFLIIGALLVCLGVAKLVIATTTKGRSGRGAASPQQESFVTGLGQPDTTEPDTAESQAVEPLAGETDNYEK